MPARSAAGQSLDSVFAAGSQYLANEPGVSLANSRLLTLIPHAVDVLTAAYRPTTRPP